MATTTLGNKKVMDIIKLKENGKMVEFYVTKHNYENGLNGAGRTLVVRKECYDQRQWHGSNVNAYATSAIDTWLNGEYKNLFEADLRAAMGTTKFYYTPGNGNTTKTTLERAVFLLSATELGQTHTYLNAEGTALEGASTLKIAYLNGSVVYQWTRSPYTDSTNGAWYLNSSGSIGSNNYCSFTHGSRPAFTLPSTLSVSDDGSVQTNAAPTVTSDSGDSGVDLGSKAEPFDFRYTVGDEDGDTLTVTEKLDGATKKTREDVSSGEALTFECLSLPEEFQKITNGPHTLTVEVSDGKDKTTFAASFTKAVYEASITLKNPLTVEGDITAAVLGVVGEIPEDAEYKVEATNNANDSEPTWQDVTVAVKTGTNIVFANTTAANGAAFNFRITVKRGSSNAGGHISAITGAFQ